MPTRRWLLPIAIVLSMARAPQQGFDARGAPAPQPIDAVLMQVFDKDMSKGVSVGEVRQTLDSFAAMSGGFAGPDGGASQMTAWIDVAKRLTPSVFKLLDADGSKSLSAKELVWFAKVQKAFNSGALRNLTRDVFDTLDGNGDSVLNDEELRAAADAESEVLSSAVAHVHTAFPLRKDANELKRLLLDVMTAAGAGMADGVALIDADGDGQIDRKEAGRAFKDAKKAFVTATKTLQEMGPMLAMVSTAPIEPLAPSPGCLLTRCDVCARAVWRHGYGRYGRSRRWWRRPWPWARSLKRSSYIFALRK